MCLHLFVRDRGDPASFWIVSFTRPNDSDKTDWQTFQFGKYVLSRLYIIYTRIVCTHQVEHC